MRFSPLVNRLYGKGSDAWKLHAEALRQQRSGRKDVIFLSVGDPDFDTPGIVADRAISAIKNGETHYTDILGKLELRRAVAKYHGRLTGQDISYDNVAILAGAQCALFATSLTLFTQGDEVIVPDPAYVTYEATIQANGARIVRVPTKPEKGFHLELDELEKAITGKTRAIMYASPNNPTGAMMTSKELAIIAGLAKKHDLWVVSDEVYASLAFDRPHESIVAFPGMAERSVVINSVSKSHAMSGWRLGWIVAPAEMIAHIGKLTLAMLYGSPSFTQMAVAEALREENDTIPNAMRQSYLDRRNRVVTRLNQIANLRCPIPEAGMFMMLDVRETGLSSHDFSWHLFEKTGLCLLDGAAFGESSNGHVRIGLVAENDILDDACDRLASFARELT